MTVRAKLALMCASVVGIQLVSAAAESWLSRRAAEFYEGARDAHGEVEQLGHVEAGLVWELKGVTDLYAHPGRVGEEELVADFEHGRELVDRGLRRYRDLVQHEIQVLGEAYREEEERRHDWITKAAREFHDAARLVAASLRNGEVEPERMLALESTFRRTMALFRQNTDEERGEIAEEDETAARWAGWATTISWAAPLASALLLLVVLGLEMRGVTRSLSDLATGATRVAAGDLDAPVPVRSVDEFGQLAAAFNEMQRSLKMRIAERDLALRDARFRDLSEAAPIAIAELDRDGRPVYANRRWLELLGAGAGEQPWSDLVSEDDRERAAELQRSPGGAAQELRLRRGDQTVWVAAQCAPLGQDDDGRTILALADISAQKLAIARAEDLGRELMTVSRKAGMAEVSAGVLHNVGNVLNSINISSASVRKQLEGSHLAGLARAARLLEERRGDLADFLGSERGKLLPEYLIQAAARLAGEQAAALADVSRVEKGIQHIAAIISTQQSYAKVGDRIEHLHLSQVIEDVLSLNATSFERDELRIARHLDVDPELLADRHKIMQILMNLIGNARHALVEGAVAGERRVEITTRLTGDGRVAVEVADNGVGIAPETLARMFEHGFTTRTTGHGFGLHSSMRAAHDLGGRLSARSDGLGRGATFLLELPLCSKEQAA
ncbi:MAG TPA: ATP-binding protein [Kofleriaceae bacterium]|nr:ATP-binding protein [Kofleriaceae bacterium]